MEGQDWTTDQAPSTSQRMKPKKAEGGTVKKKPSMIMQIDNFKRKYSKSLRQGPPVGSMNKK